MKTSISLLPSPMKRTKNAVREGNKCKYDLQKCISKGGKQFSVFLNRKLKC